MTAPTRFSCHSRLALQETLSGLSPSGYPCCLLCLLLMHLLLLWYADQRQPHIQLVLWTHMQLTAGSRQVSSCTASKGSQSRPELRDRLRLQSADPHRQDIHQRQTGRFQTRPLGRRYAARRLDVAISSRWADEPALDVPFGRANLEGLRV